MVSDRNDELMEMFHSACEKRGVLHTPDDCFRYTSELPDKYEQMSIFDMEVPLDEEEVGSAPMDG